MTKVLHVIPTLDRGGAERSLVQLATAQAGGDEDISQRIVTLRAGGAFAETARRAGIPLTSLDIDGAPGLPRGVWRLTRLIAGWRPDIIQGWLYYGDLVACFAHALTPGPSPRLLWNIRCSELDFSAYGPLLRQAVRIAARLSGRPEAIVVNSKAGARAHEALGYRPEKFVLIANGVDTGKFAPDAEAGARIRADLGLGAASKIVAHIGRVDPQKDHGTLIEVARQLPDIVFVAAGRGTEELDGPENLIALGDRDDIADLMNAADIVLSTSAYGEGFPNVLAEAMACGTPVVSTDCGDAQAIVGDTGLIVPIGQPDAAARALTDMFSLPPAQRRALGADARTRMIELYALDKFRRRFFDLWQTKAHKKAVHNLRP